MLKRDILYFLLAVVIAILLSGCQQVQEYNEVVYRYGKMIVDNHKIYIEKDESLSIEEKKMMQEVCDEYIKLVLASKK